MSDREWLLSATFRSAPPTTAKTFGRYATLCKVCFRFFDASVDWQRLQHVHQGKSDD